ncbi:MAG TPA: NAD(P)-binding domain-containing protein [Gemmatimonadales bacterium]|nr:NAD(P)-binding domain-containing protein [Gemmatimonadales bacterium]
MDSTLVYALFIALVLISVVRQYRKMKRGERRALAAAESGATDVGPGQHPHIDVSRCIGCGACVTVCPEGEVLGLVGGKAAIINAAKCIGHGLCADACPVGAIEIVTAPPGITAGLPRLTAEYETSVPMLFVVGELGGLALIKNAVNQGRDAVDVIFERLRRAGPTRDPAVRDVCVVGAGPGGISASLRAVERKLTYATFEQEELGGTVAKYPRQKLVLTSPVEFPMYGSFKKLAISKEELLRFWEKLHRETGLTVYAGERVEAVTRDADGHFTVRTAKRSCRSRSVVLALGRRGTPRKLGIPGENLPHVMYSLLDAEAYREARILVVGGGDSAVEAALGLAYQPGNRVTLSYRKEAFSRLKGRNDQRITKAMRAGQIDVVFNSTPRRIEQTRVVLEVQGTSREVPAEYVWVFAGSIAATEILEQAGVDIGTRDLTAEARAAAR